MDWFPGKTPQPDGSELAAKLVSLFSFSLLSALFGIKTYNVHYKYLTYSRWLVLALYVISWAFTTISMLLVTTNNRNFVSCFLSIMVCDIFYSGTKLVIYAWLIEKVYVVSSVRKTRWRSRTYRFHLCLMLPYVAIFTLMLIFHVAEIEESGVCIIGLQSVASLPLLIYDFLINLYMTILFVRPLFKLGMFNLRKVDWKTSRLNEVALRTLVASLVCLIASFANIFALVMFEGRERGLVCLTCCTVDVIINVVTIHWVTSHTPGARGKDTTNMDYSAQQRDSTPDLADDQKIYLKTTDTSAMIHPNDVDFIAANQLQFTRFTNNDSKIECMKTAPPYSAANGANDATHLEKCDDQHSTDSHFFTSSIHESHSSRRSLTKK